MPTSGSARRAGLGLGFLALAVVATVTAYRAHDRNPGRAVVLVAGIENLGDYFGSRSRRSNGDLYNTLVSAKSM